MDVGASPMKRVGPPLIIEPRPGLPQNYPDEWSSSKIEKGRERNQTFFLRAHVGKLKERKKLRTWGPPVLKTVVKQPGGWDSSRGLIV